MLKVPEEARELDKELRSVTKEKNEAVRNQDFEKVRTQTWGCPFKSARFTAVPFYRA